MKTSESITASDIKGVNLYFLCIDSMMLLMLMLHFKEQR